MSSSIDAGSENALALEAFRVESACCRFAPRVSAAKREGFESLLDLALSEEVRKYISLFEFVWIFCCSSGSC